MSAPTTTRPAEPGGQLLRLAEFRTWRRSHPKTCLHVQPHPGGGWALRLGRDGWLANQRGLVRRFRGFEEAFAFLHAEHAYWFKVALAAYDERQGRFLWWTPRGITRQYPEGGQP